MDLNYWYTYRENIDMAYFTNKLWPTTILLDLTNDFGKIFSSTSALIQTTQTNTVQVEDPTLQDSFSNILTIIARLENVYDLPASLMLNTINTPVRLEAVNLLELQNNILESQCVLIECVPKNEIFEIQYHLNVLTQDLITLSLMLGVDLEKLITKQITVKKVVCKTTSKEEFDLRKYAIETSGKKQIIINLKGTQAKPYSAITVTYGRKVFDSGSIVKDFFKASTYIRNLNEQQIKFKINYGINLRKFLQENPQFYLGYLIDDKLISATEYHKDITAKKQPIIGGKEPFPIIITKELNSIEKFLDYIK